MDIAIPFSAIMQVVEHGVVKEAAMETRTWIFGVVVVLVIVGYFALQPRGEAPTDVTDSPAFTEEPAEPAPTE
jgi:hypothetical protein